ncbi:cleavage polyadenylation factor subunit MPE1 KNAG_0A07230 [Huiozyma naganishii CBS 8797]|uniref:DWNN domain-containing protein n=1 Tax=Huiozyma naganishii (strain ATCC MYA-139 / BCRC 22969 / CBS 8797 / KCTC 17520 / NBRC 10181 / NCYC 3082 / Yp74L-3) TaxID=1071383 RepID=J7S441_HUIN7|nr:hypothetical protein KNAG_0A07230 [Kazachstania naganishii CBS 8797]CCK68376.1 hypothetical protein KNAG_0A07230 [Kazachstania naganishii CBS 8797]
MSSTIFYRFKSQKGTSRILFDGTGLTVFELKRDIIQENRLGDGTDFQLRVYNPDTMEEYDEDQAVIPRSSNVVARRSPAVRAVSVHSRARPGGAAAAAGGNAARYVTGKPRVFARRGNAAATSTTTQEATPSGVTEEERIANMFATQENQWEQTQQAMSGQTPVFFRSGGGGGAGGAGHGDDGPPPPGYMCYRCGAKDHWIKNCPTNNDPNFEGKRIRRTTGIPKKFLKSVEIDPSTMTPEEMSQRKIMITDEGKFVVQVADQHSWEDYQRKQQKVAAPADLSVWAPGRFPDLPTELKCPITGGLLRDPVRTSHCCKRAFSKTAIEDTLLETDFVCPGCGAQDTLLDSLEPDKTLQAEAAAFLQRETAQGPEGAGDASAKRLRLDPAAPTAGSTGPGPVPPAFALPPFPLFPLPPFMPRGQK